MFEPNSGYTTTFKITAQTSDNTVTYPDVGGQILLSSLAASVSTSMINDLDVTLVKMAPNSVNSAKVVWCSCYRTIYWYLLF